MVRNFDEGMKVKKRITGKRWALSPLLIAHTSYLSVLTIVSMAMRGFAAEPVIEIVCKNYQEHGRDQQPDMILVKPFLEQQK